VNEEALPTEGCCAKKQTNKRNFSWDSSHPGSLSEGNQIVVTGNACKEKGSRP